MRVQTPLDAGKSIAEVLRASPGFAELQPWKTQADPLTRNIVMEAHGRGRQRDKPVARPSGCLSIVFAGLGMLPHLHQNFRTVVLVQVAIAMIAFEAELTAPIPAVIACDLSHP